MDTLTIVENDDIRQTASYKKFVERRMDGRRPQGWLQVLVWWRRLEHRNLSSPASTGPRAGGLIVFFIPISNYASADPD